MDLKGIIVAIVQFLHILVCIATSDDKNCGLGFLWDDTKQTCVGCLDVCPSPRASMCIERCFGTSKKLNTLFLKRRRRDIKNACGDVKCPPGTYCDEPVGDCTSCGVICDHSHIQGTAKRCNSLCAGYVTPPATTTTTTTTTTAQTITTTTKPRIDESGSDNAWSPFVLPIICTILGILLLMGIIGLGYLGYRYGDRILQYCRVEEKRRAVPCSQDSELEYINSQTPLTNANSPIREAENSPITATAAPLVRNLGPEMGFPEVQCPYTELDRPETPSTAPKRFMVKT